MPPEQHDMMIATTNPGKLAEIRVELEALGVRAIGLADLPDRPVTPEETGTTFLENALIKARSYASQTGRRCLADDSGLVVDALDGAPGVISSHYATSGVETGVVRADRDKANNEALLAALGEVPEGERTARFVCIMVVVGPDGEVIAKGDGAFEGRIGIPPVVPRGGSGFGYDPLFLIGRSVDRTSAELTPEEKNALSHRGIALRAVISQLRGSA